MALKEFLVNYVGRFEIASNLSQPTNRRIQ